MRQRAFTSFLIPIWIITTLLVITSYFIIDKDRWLSEKSTIPDLAQTTQTPTKNKSQTATAKENKPTIKYQIFNPGARNTETLNSVYVSKNDSLPKEVQFGDVNFSIKRMEISSKVVGGVSAYVIISYNNQEEKIGFWHPDDPTQDKYLKTNACSTGTKTYDWVCGGFLTVGVKNWNRVPTPEEKARGIINVYYSTSIFLEELDYDFKSNDWNYAKISLGLYEEKQYAPVAD